MAAGPFGTTVFAGASGWVDRLNNRRRDMEGLMNQALPTAGECRVAVLLFDQDLKVAHKKTATDSGPLWWQRVNSQADRDALYLVATQHLREWVFLGQTTREYAAHPSTGDVVQYSNTRNFALQRAAHDDVWTIALVAHARSCFEYMDRHRFCSKCGVPSTVKQGGHEIKCGADECGLSCFPRSDPVVIMLAVDPATDRVLLGRQAAWPPGLHSALAGFMEHGEAAEEAVARELFEESGVRVDLCRYHSSQPWPFPYSLMLGFMARATSTDILVDQHELETAAWYTRDEVRAALAAGSHPGADPLTAAAPAGGSDPAPTLRLPPKGTIAHELCQTFVAADPICKF
ncbi:uncharacterized protein MONBRDRAFT_11913 [Monosiga brevicollis MX1]|uniref:NAD(+) diphosphatase n=1 Tax=Monosiga brevicollis TaxID=81824 RepID=A9VAN3_MONBE|nr:uncharacterized protein MONBRDRAFT_11913 [Monosiga brevicollis MX1]EDQ85352.1 predicted protein [Monosiga brevicollis MX1]|eukprot:XP_001749763.1 hypothetical protein [Monosiga brevicollis MX1]